MSEVILDRTAVAEDRAGLPAYRVPAAEKALDILEFMADRPEGVTQTEISIGVGRSIHEIYRIIQLLEKRGYLVRAPRSDRYRLSLKLFELAHKHPPLNRLIDVALPAMRALANDTDQSCHLAVLRDLRILVILQIDSPLPMRYSVAVGAEFPIIETSSGAVLLANLPEAERAQLVERILASDPSADRDGIASRVADILRIGYEMRPSLAVEGCTNISLPIRDHVGHIVAAVTVPYLPQKAARFDRKTVLRRAQSAASEISRGLGAPERPRPASADTKR
ncbi:MAG TPA: IclR family transcriptional regulator [Bauldia sp.]|nr:IclR family transcriptional regulator [Bauldia sp.]